MRNISENSYSVGAFMRKYIIAFFFVFAYHNIAKAVTLHKNEHFHKDARISQKIDHTYRFLPIFSPF